MIVTETLSNYESEQKPTRLNKVQLAKEIGVSQRTISNWMQQRKIPYIKVGGRVLYSLERVLGALDKFEFKSLSQ